MNLNNKTLKASPISKAQTSKNLRNEPKVDPSIGPPIKRMGLRRFESDSDDEEDVESVSEGLDK